MWTRMDECRGGQREWEGEGRDRSVSVKDETPKQVSKRQTDRQNTLGMAGRVSNTIIGHIEGRTKNAGQ